MIAPLLAQAQTGGLGEAITSQAQGGGAGEFWVFWVLAPLSLATGIAMVALRNPIHAALMLVLNFFTIAVFYAVLEAQFLSAIQVIVYAGAIMVLFLFVLMLLGTGGEEERRPERLRGQRSAALLLGAALAVGLIGTVAGPFLRTESACSSSSAVQVAVQEAGPAARQCTGLVGPNGEDGGNPRAVGMELFTDYVWPFEVTSLLLVVAAIGAMVLGKRHEDEEDLIERTVAEADADDEERQRVPAMVGAGAGTGAVSATRGTAASADPIGERGAPADDDLLSGDDPLAPAEADLVDPNPSLAVDVDRDADADADGDADADAGVHGDDPEPQERHP